MKYSYINIFLIFSFNNIYENNSHVNQLKNWFNQIKSSKYDCKPPEIINVKNQEPLIEVVGCDDPKAIYQYDYKVNNKYGSSINILDINKGAAKFQILGGPITTRKK